MATVGLFGIGLDTYWAQFKGLKERLLGYQDQVAVRLASTGATVVNAGLVDSSEEARRAATLLAERRVDLVFLYVSTYALSHTVLPIAQAVHAPFVILNLQPSSSLDYSAFNAMGDRGLMTGEWLANCQACSVPELANVFNNSGIHYDIVTGWLGEDASWARIGEWVRAAQALRALREARIGILGHYYCGMLDVYTDVARLAATFGCHFEILEMDLLKRYRDEVGKGQVEVKLMQFRDEFLVAPECEAAELDRAATTSCALDRMVAEKGLGGLAYYYEGEAGNAHENIVTSVIPGNTLLTAHGVPVAGECEVKNVVAMKILDSLGAGGSFSEFYYLDFDDDVVLLGHDGPAHAGIAEGRVSLVPLPLYHGKPGKGLSIQMSVKRGPVTLLSVVQGPGGTTSLLVAEGECVAGPTFQIGNTNSRYRFPIPARKFMEDWSKAGPAHHCAIGTGQVAATLEKLSDLLGITCLRIC